MNPIAVMVCPETRGEARVNRHARHPREVRASPVAHPLPAHHATLAVHLEGMPSGLTVRALALRHADDTVEIYAPLLAYLREHPRRSGTWQNDVTRAVGLLWDFSRARADVSTSAMPIGGRAFLQDLFRAFALSLSSGTIENGSDPSGLYWPSSSLSVCRKMIRGIEDFAAWCHARPSATWCECDPIRPPDEGLGFTDILVWSRLRNVEMLRHISVKPRTVRRRSLVDLGKQARGHGLEPVKFFPRKHADRLLWHGHRRPNPSSSIDPHATHNVRDQMMALLDGWGGLRRSEGLHLWVGDVTENPEKPGHALVVLHHPTESLIEYPDPISRRMTIGSRAEVLNRIYGLRARNEVTRGSYHAGWKGMELDKECRAVVFWSDDRAGALFWLLYLTYLRFVRSDVMRRRRAAGGRDHPFLLVSEGEDRNADSKSVIGDPYSLRAYERNHKAAVRRLALPYGKSHGTTTHGLRHMYGRTLADLRLSPEIIRKGMRHVSPLSQLVYVVPDKATTNARLREAWDRLEATRAEPSNRENSAEATLGPGALGEDTTRALLRLRAKITGGGGVE